jgi:hypothetical protein
VFSVACTGAEKKYSLVPGPPGADIISTQHSGSGAASVLVLRVPTSGPPGAGRRRRASDRRRGFNLGHSGWQDAELTLQRASGENLVSTAGRKVSRGGTQASRFHEESPSRAELSRCVQRTDRDSESVSGPSIAYSLGRPGSRLRAIHSPCDSKPGGLVTDSECQWVRRLLHAADSDSEAFGAAAASAGARQMPVG